LEHEQHSCYVWCCQHDSGAKQDGCGEHSLAANTPPGWTYRIGEERNNWYRLKRAIEVLLHTGKPLAESSMPLLAKWIDLKYDFRPFFLTRPRLDIFRRIDERVERMVRHTSSLRLVSVSAIPCTLQVAHIPHLLNLMHHCGWHCSW
jgi:hypothetical protein